MSTGKNDKMNASECPSCGGNLTRSSKSIYDEDEEEDIEVPLALCVQCGAEYDQHTGEFYSIFADDYTYDVDSSIFSLGLKGELNGTEYEIIGHIRYQEEDEYEKSTWDEWVAVSSEGTFCYFVEEEGSVFSYTDYIPESIDLESNPEKIEFEGKYIDREEGYGGRLVYAEGELPWQPEIGEYSLCFDFKKDGVHYSIEQSEDEVSITKGERVTYGELIRIFNIEEYKDAYESTVNKRKNFRNRGRVYKLGLLVSILLSFYSCFSSKPVNGIMNQRKVFAVNSPMIEDNKVMYRSQVLYGPFDVTDTGSLHAIKVRVDESIQRLTREWQSFRLMLIGKDRFENRAGEKMTDPAYLSTLFKTIDSLEEPLESYTVEGDFWDEDGYDSDGYWHESDLSAESDFVIDSDGKYYFYLELYSQKPRNHEAVVISMSKVMGYRYFIVIAVIFLILWAINSVRSRFYNELPFEMFRE